MLYADTLKEQLFLIINSRISLKDLQITSDCERMLKKVIEIGIERMVVGKLVDRQTPRSLAKQSLVQLLESMENQAQKFKCYPILDNKTFEAVKHDDISLWPFFCTGS